MSEAWVALFSGGKDSAYALHRALETGRAVERLLTVHPSPASYMYHVPLTDIAALAAESIGIDLLEVDPGDFQADVATDAGDQGDREIEPLEASIASLSRALDGRLAGVTAGAVESEFQTSRIRSMCERQDLELFAPLWQRHPGDLLEEMLEAGFEIRIVQVAAAGLDESWLGRRLDEEAVAELRALQDRSGVHLLGEGGEFETLVTDGPHMERRIRLDYETVWEGTRGRIDVEDAWLA